MLLLAIKTMTCSCHSDSRKGFENVKKESHIKETGRMPAVADENSGLAWSDKEGFFWTHNDSGGKSELYRVNKSGDLDSVWVVPGAVNVDWEDLARDDEGNIYIGDFGNNSQKRKNLMIYKMSPSGKVEKIGFSYKDQTEYPAASPDFDCEAFFWYENHLYLFTKSWEKKKSREITKLYRLSDQPGNYEIEPSERYRIGMKVTAVDISPDRTKYALLTYGKLFIFGIENHIINFSKPLACLKTGRKQTEGLLFTDNHTVMFTNEQGHIYLLRLDGSKI